MDTKEWKEVVKAVENVKKGGGDVGQYLRDNNINHGAYYSARKRLIHGDKTTKRKYARKNPPAGDFVKFVPAASSTVKLILTSGVILEVAYRDLKTVLEVLR